MSDEMKDLTTALGLDYKDVLIRKGSERVRVEEFSIEQIPDVTKLIFKIVETMIGSAGDGDTDEMDFLANILAGSGETGLLLLSLSARKPVEHFSRISMTDGIALYSALLEVNQSFFAQAEQIKGLFKQISTLIGNLGIKVPQPDGPKS